MAPAGRLAGGAQKATEAPQRARRSGPQGSRAAAGPKRPPGSAPGASKAAPALVKRRDELSRNFAELQWDLGGIAYEMARRDHYRLEVLNAQAAKLQEVDAELGQIERMVKLDEAGAAGDCPSCGALQARGASFCWRCGKEIKTAAPKPAKPAKASANEEAPKAAKLRRPRSKKSEAAHKGTGGGSSSKGS